MAALAVRNSRARGVEPPRNLTIYRGYGALDFDKCKRHAVTLLEWAGQDVDEWVRSTNSYAVSPNCSPAWTAEPSLSHVASSRCVHFTRR
jgi:hypothetical protein